jgi:hypothetical protein
LATQLANFVNAIDHGQRLKDFEIMISSWHYFREVCDWQTDVLVEAFGELEVRGDVQVRGRGFGGEVMGRMKVVGLGGRMRDGGGGRKYGREVSERSCGDTGEDVDWEWEGGVVL